MKPQVYAGLFVSADDFEDFREALEKLTLNDASLIYEPETSDALGFGFRMASWECFTWRSSKSDSSASMIWI